MHDRSVEPIVLSVSSAVAAVRQGADRTRRNRVRTLDDSLHQYAGRLSAVKSMTDELMLGSDLRGNGAWRDQGF